MFPAASVKIDLRRIGASNISRVCYGARRSNSLAASAPEVLILEGRVAQAVTECVYRFPALLRVPPVTDFGALIVTDGDGRFPCSAEAGQLRPVVFRDRLGT